MSFEENEISLIYNPAENAYICGITKKSLDFNYTFHTVETEKEKDLVRKSRENLLKKLSFKQLITLKQFHSDKIYILNEKNLAYFDESNIEGDGLITDLRGVLIGVSTADCVPLTYLSRTKKVCGIAHAGWKGIYKKIHTKIVEEIKENFKIFPDELTVIIGPHIMDCCYSVGKDMLEFFPEKYFKNLESLFLNLSAIIKDELISFGILETNILSLNLCSKCNEKLFYSYRRGEEKSRNLSFAGIKET